MTDTWLEDGHGAAPSHLAVVFSSVQRQVNVASAAVAGSYRVWPGNASSRWISRFSRPVVATVLWCGICIGAAGTAWIVQDALFPSIGHTAVSVWSNPGRDFASPTPTAAMAPADRSADNDQSGSDTEGSTTGSTTVPTTSTAAPPNSIDEPTSPPNAAAATATSAADSDDVTTSSVDDSGPDTSGPDTSGPDDSVSDNSGRSGPGPDNSTSDTAVPDSDDDSSGHGGHGHGGAGG